MRHSANLISKEILRRFISRMHRFNIPSNNKLIYERPFLSTHFRNLAIFFKEVDHLEEAYGRHIWNLHYIHGWELFGKHNYQYHKYFSITIITLLERLFSSVIMRDWNIVASIIENIPLGSKAQIHSSSYETVAESMSIYFPNIFLVSLQRFLISYKSIDVVSDAYLKASEKFSKAIVRKSHPLNHSTYYVVQCLIFHLANLKLEVANSILTIQHKGTNLEWLNALHIYKYCNDCEHWLSEGDTYVGKQEVANLFHTAFKSLLDNPTNGIGLLPLFVCLAKNFECVHILCDELEELCIQMPRILIWVYEILTRFELHHIATRLFEMVIHSSTSILASEDFIVNIVEQRTLSISQYSDAEDVARTNLRLLFTYLDYGRNREDALAWSLLQLNLEFVQFNLNIFVADLWRERTSWWKQFHSVKLPKKTRRIRRNVFNILESLT